MQCLPGGGPSGCEVYSVVIDVFQEAVYLSGMGVPPETWVAKKAAYVTAPKLTISPTHPLLSKKSDIILISVIREVLVFNTVNMQGWIS